MDALFYNSPQKFNPKDKHYWVVALVPDNIPNVKLFTYYVFRHKRKAEIACKFLTCTAPTPDELDFFSSYAKPVDENNLELGLKSIGEVGLFDTAQEIAKFCDSKNWICAGVYAVNIKTKDFKR